MALELQVLRGQLAVRLYPSGVHAPHQPATRNIGGRGRGGSLREQAQRVCVCVSPCSCSGRTRSPAVVIRAQHAQRSEGGVLENVNCKRRDEVRHAGGVVLGCKRVTNERYEQDDYQHPGQREGHGHQHDLTGVSVSNSVRLRRPLVVCVQRAQQQGKAADDPQGQRQGTRDLERWCALPFEQRPLHREHANLLHEGLTADELSKRLELYR